MQSTLAHSTAVHSTEVHLLPQLNPFLSGGGDEPLKVASQISDTPPVKTSKPFVLVVDDAPDVTEMLAMLLRLEGYEVVTANSASSAIEEARVNQFDIIVSDIGMPNMDGYELATALRALPSYDAVPMIAVTGFSMYGDRARALASGFNEHLTKPINPTALLDLILRLRT
jgi:CheY-like chemotaxis protein